MPLHAIRTRSLSEQVFEQLATEIITGRWLPGTNLPAERALTVVFDVNRHVVREALKRLEQIVVASGTSTTGTAGWADMNEPATRRSRSPRFIRDACSLSAAAVALCAATE